MSLNQGGQDRRSGPRAREPRIRQPQLGGSLLGSARGSGPSEVNGGMKLSEAGNPSDGQVIVTVRPLEQSTKQVLAAMGLPPR